MDALRSEEINEYLKESSGEEFSAKDFRTWNATVMAAVSLAADGRDAGSKTRASGRSTARSEPSPSCSATRRPSRDAHTSIRGCSTATSRAGRSRARSSALTELDPADDRIRAKIERAVLDLLAERHGLARRSSSDSATARPSATLI